MLIVVVLAVVSGAAGQMVKQCQCHDFDPCYTGAADSVIACADRCQGNFVSLGANYAAARACFVSHLGQLRGTLSCARSSFGQVCSAGPGGMVPKRYPETMQLAFFREISHNLQRSGVMAQATSLIQVARKGVGCIMKCVQAQGCIKRLNCGLALPSDNQIVQVFKTCAVNSGFLSQSGFQQICSCLGNAGIKQLTPLCNKISLF